MVPVARVKQPSEHIFKPLNYPSLANLFFGTVSPCTHGRERDRDRAAPQYLHGNTAALICSCQPIWADGGRFVNSAKVLWVAMFLAKLVFAPGSGEAEWSWTHANKRFCSWGQSCLLAPDLHSYTESHCFPFIASCHSLCQSLIRTMSFHRLISHSSNFLTLHNERERNSKGLAQKEG